MRASIGISVLVLVALAGCGGSVDGTGGSGTTTKSGEGGKASGGSGGMGTGGSSEGGKCHKQLDCGNGETCLPPGSPDACGTCLVPPATCNSDAECAANGPASICEPAHCACSGQKSCTDGCTSSASCGVGESCEADHRCKPSVCAQQLDCPTNFLCPPVLDSRCTRRTCTVDPECDVGYCVEGFCYDVLGQCTPPVP